MEEVLGGLGSGLTSRLGLLGRRGPQHTGAGRSRSNLPHPGRPASQVPRRDGGGRWSPLVFSVVTAPKAALALRSPTPPGLSVCLSSALAHSLCQGHSVTAIPPEASFKLPA